MDFVEAGKIVHQKQISEGMCEQFGVIEVPKNSSQDVEVKTTLISGFLNGARLSKCPRLRAGKMLRSPQLSFRSDFLCGCVKTQTSSGSVQWSRISMRGWCMIRLHEPSSLRGFGHSWEE